MAKSKAQKAAPPAARAAQAPAKNTPAPEMVNAKDGGGEGAVPADAAGDQAQTGSTAGAGDAGSDSAPEASSADPTAAAPAASAAVEPAAEGNPAPVSEPAPAPAPAVEAPGDQLVKRTAKARHGQPYRRGGVVWGAAFQTARVTPAQAEIIDADPHLVFEPAGA